MIAHHHVAPPFANVAPTAFSGWRRWGLAVAVSLALHAALLWGLRGMPPQTPPTSVAPDRSVHWLAATLLPAPPTQAKTQSTTQPTAQPKTAPITTPTPTSISKREPRAPAQPQAQSNPLPPQPSPPAADAPTLPALPKSLASTQPAVPAAPAAAGAQLALSRPPQLLPDKVQPPPRYPALSQRLGEQGTVWLRAEVGADGRVQQVQLLKPSPYPRLNRAAQDAVSQWQYHPGTDQGTPVAMWLEVPVRFELR
ncbi:MAG: energy transducer TonB [Burkholderiaceae bacterium]